MTTKAYETRKRIFKTDDIHSIVYRCRRCGNDQIYKIKDIPSSLIFKCSASHCNTKYQFQSYNLIYRILSFYGNVGRSPRYIRFKQWRYFTEYHNIKHNFIME